MTEKIRIHTSTSDTIGEWIVSIFKIYTEEFLVQNTKLNGLQETLLVHLESAPKIEVLDEIQINIVTNHLRLQNTRVKLSVVSDNISAARTNEFHKVDKYFSEWSTLTHSTIFRNTVDINRTLTDLKIQWLDNSIKCVHQTTTIRKSSGWQWNSSTRVILSNRLRCQGATTHGKPRGLKIKGNVLHTAHKLNST